MNTPRGLRRSGAGLLLAALALGPGAPRAQSPADAASPGGEVSILKLFYAEEDLLTAATRTPQSARTAPAVAEVYTGEELERMGVRTLSELLARVASVYVSTQTNSRDSVWFRGVRNRYNDKILLLVDGVPLRDPVYGHSPTDEYLPLAAVERVEVIRGPGSALYGTNAFAGVVQIVTKRPPETPAFRAWAGGGSHDTREVGVEGGGSWEGNGLYAWGTGFETDGDGLTRETHYKPQALAWNPKESRGAGGTFTRGGLTLSGRYLHYFHTFYGDRDVPTWRWADEGYWYDDLFLSAKYARALTDHLSFTGILYTQAYDWRNYWRQFAYGHDGPDATGADVVYEISVDKESRRHGADLQFNWSPSARHELVFGATWERESIRHVEDRYHALATGETFVPYYISPRSLTSAAAYAQETWRPREWATFTGGLRADHHEVFGWHLSPRLAATFLPGPRSVFRLLYGEAFRAPSPRELYTVDLFASFPPGNPHLKPEQVRTAEATFSYTFSEYAQLQFVGYYQETEDTIFSEAGRPYENHRGGSGTGAEASLRLAWPNHVTARLTASYTGSDAYNVPALLAYGELNVPFRSAWNWNLSARYVGERPRDPADLFKYDTSRPPYHRDDVSGYLTVDTTLLAKGLWKRFDFSLTVRDLFDAEGWEPTFEPTKYYDLERPGRAILLRVGVRF